VGVSLNTVTGALTVGGIYDNNTAVPQRFLVTATARVTGAALTTAQNNVNRVNTARFDGDDRFGGQPLTAVTATYTVNVRQPNPAIVKTNDRPGTVIGGQLVTYTVAVTNQNSASSITNRPPLHARRRRLPALGPHVRGVRCQPWSHAGGRRRHQRLRGRHNPAGVGAGIRPRVAHRDHAHLHRDHQPQRGRRRHLHQHRAPHRWHPQRRQAGVRQPRQPRRERVYSVTARRPSSSAATVW
jgi:hypothetical protein